MEEQLLETWAIHDRINVYVLEALSVEALAARAGRGRTVAEQFAHVHNVRLMWHASAAPDLAAALTKLDKDTALSKAGLKQALTASGAAITVLLKQAFASGGRVKGFKPHAAAFLGYLIAHESHHRGQVALTLKLAGHPLDKKVAYGMWEWGTR
jgi:uncharacterized damage-inducible protein DinB